MHELYELKEKLMNELSEYGSKEEMTASSLDIVDKLAHTIKNLCKIIEDMEYSERGSSYEGGSYYEGGSSYEGGSMRRGSSYDGGSSYRGSSYRGSSYEGSGRGSSYDGGSSYTRGRGRNARRDSRGRYSSGNEMMIEQLQELMDEAPDERTRQEIQKLMSKLG